MKAFVCSGEFDDESDGCVEDHVEGHLRTGMAAFRVVSQQDEEDEEVQGRFEQLGREYGERGRGGRGDETRVELFAPRNGAVGESHGQAGVGGSAIAAAVQEAADSSDAMAQGHHGDDEVEDVGDTLPAFDAEQDQGGAGEEESPIEHEAALLHHDDVFRVHRIIRPVFDDVGEAGTD